MVSEVVWASVEGIVNPLISVFPLYFSNNILPTIKHPFIIATLHAVISIT